MMADVQESDPNEILVGTNTDVGEHIARAIGLLEVSYSSLTLASPLVAISFPIAWELMTRTPTCCSW
jgi:hypothetical protein